MKRFYFIFFIIFYFSGFVFTQISSEKKHKLGIESGLFHCRIKDDLASPVTYSGSGFPARISYGYYGVQSIHYLEFSYIFHDINSKLSGHFGDHYGNLLLLQGKYGFVRFRKKYFDNRARLYLGLNLDCLYAKKEYYYFSGINEIFRELTFSISPSIYVKYGLKNKQYLTFQFSIPVLTCIMRPSYSGKMDFTPFFTSVNKYLGFESSAAYEFVLTKSFNIRIQYYFMYYRYPDPRIIRTSMDYLSLKILYKI